MEKTGYTFILVDVSNDLPKGMGTRKFRAPPRKGEYITIDDDEDIAQAYEVVVVIHPEEFAATCGDLIVRHGGTDIEFRKRLGAHKQT